MTNDKLTKKCQKLLKICQKLPEGSTSVLHMSRFFKLNFQRPLELFCKC